VAGALREDLGSGDLTTRAVVSPDLRGTGEIVARQPLVVCGLPVMAEVFSQVDPSLLFRPLVDDGAAIAEVGQVLAEIGGSMASILVAERVALNFAQRLSGIATLTRKFCSRIPKDSKVRLVDTRKTTPGLRVLEKYAVRAGGGHNHRFGLDDGVMIKDNHIIAAGSIGEAVRRARDGCHHLVQIDVVTTLRSEAPGVVLEASGGITLDTVATFAATGVDFISCGALTHQARSVDLALDLRW
jgi:nicotinate-nucleotide pyrophosphorylase (carboxylating)